MTVSSFPIFLVDFTGSILMIVFSFLCLRIVNALRSRDQNNLIWTYLLWVCIGLACFAVSRSAGHILKNILILTGHRALWTGIRPFSGAVNSVMFIVVAAITLFFERIWKIYQLILKDRQEIKSAHRELLFLNQNLEQIIDERTLALKTSEFKYRRIFEVSKDMILVATPDGLIQDLNPAGRKLLGLDSETALTAGMPVQDFLKERDDWLKLETAISADGSISNVEINLQTADGVTKRTLLSGTRARDETGDTLYCLVKDIEQRLLIEAQMAQADKLASIGELSSGVAHEINNPLGIILGYTQLLLREEKPDSPRHADFKTIEKHAQSCKAIVEDLLSFARTSKPTRETVDIHTIIEEVVDFVQCHTGLEKIEIKKQYDQGLQPLILDQKKIKQVIMNLVMNARHAIGKAGTLTVATHRDPDSGNTCVIIKDTGYGIEKKNLPRIFDPFFTTKPTGEGNGLGLSVSYGIIKSHGGDITVTSEPGKGSEFVISIPPAP
jgi:two-component system, NtrC family, sensor kinase